jgi:hypothetical protein
MELADILRKVEEAGKNNAVARSRFNDIYVWPVFRAQLISMFRNPEQYFADYPERKPESLSWKQKLLYRWYCYRFRRNFRRHLKETFAGKDAADVMLYSRNGTHSDKINGRWYDRFVDPIHDLIGQQVSVIKFELRKPKQEEKSARTIAPLFADEGDFRSYWFYHEKLHPRAPLSRSENAKEIQRATGFDFRARHVDSAFGEILFYRELFREVFKVCRPKFIFLKCFYEHDAAGLVLAAKESGIKTIDVQHGKQGVYHPMYSHWNCLPEEGYELLPDYFWTWGEESKTNIGKWMNGNQKHQPVVGGNLWLSKWKREDVHTFSEAEKNKIAQWQQAGKIVLVTLQPLDKDKVVTPVLAEAIRRAPADWIWLMRRHPFMEFTESDVRKYIGSHSANIEVELASSLPLYALLKLVNHHVTGWSSTGFEANNFGVPTVIIHPTGHSLYAEHIAQNIFSKAQTAEELLATIERNTQNIYSDYIETGLEFAESAMRHIGMNVKLNGSRI